MVGDPADLACAGGRRLPLPTYPFERTRYWVGPGAKPTGGDRPLLHPTLLDANVSTLDGLAFEKYLTGREFYLTDHVVGGAAVLPGVVHLELARLAGELAGQRPVRAVSGLVWGLPVQPGPDGLRLRVRLGERLGERLGTRTADGARFEIVSVTGGTASVSHASGVLRFGEPAPLPRLDVAAVRDRCSTVRSREECYARVTALGFEYGPSLRAVDEVRHGADEALATLALPDSRRADTAGYRFEPALLDGALQVVGWIVDTAAANGATGQVPYLPFSIDDVRLLGDLPDTCLVHAVRVRSGAGVQVFDLTITDSDGVVVCRIDGFALRASAGRDGDEPAAFVPTWRPVTDRTVTDEPVTGPPASDQPATVVFLGDAGPDLVAAAAPATAVTRRPGEPVADLVARLAGAPSPVVLVQTPPARSDLEGALDDGFHLARELAAGWVAASRGSARWLYLYDLDGDHAELHGAMAGFARSLGWEYPELELRVVGHAGVDRGDGAGRRADQRRPRRGESGTRRAAGPRLGPGRAARRVRDPRHRPGRAPGHRRRRRPRSGVRLLADRGPAGGRRGAGRADRARAGRARAAARARGRYPVHQRRPGQPRRRAVGRRAGPAGGPAGRGGAPGGHAARLLPAAQEPCGRRRRAPAEGARGGLAGRGHPARPPALLPGLLLDRRRVRQRRPGGPRHRQRLPRPDDGPPGRAGRGGGALRGEPVRAVATVDRRRCGRRPGGGGQDDAAVRHAPGEHPAGGGRARPGAQR